MNTATTTATIPGIFDGLFKQTFTCTQTLTRTKKITRHKVNTQQNKSTTNFLFIDFIDCPLLNSPYPLSLFLFGDVKSSFWSSSRWRSFGRSWFFSAFTTTTTITITTTTGEKTLKKGWSSWSDRLTAIDAAVKCHPTDRPTSPLDHLTALANHFPSFFLSFFLVKWTTETHTYIVLLPPPPLFVCRITERNEHLKDPI